MQPDVLDLALAWFQPHIYLPGGATANVQIVLRWIHFLAGITWVGLLFFFNLVNVPFMKEIDPGTKAKVVPTLLPRALWWFRWASVVTVLAGLAYWMMIVAADRRNAETAASGTAIWSFFLIWTIAFALEMGILMGPAKALQKGPVLAVVMTLVIALAAYFFLWLNSEGWESNRLLAIGIGGGIGWFMMLNVWGIIWRVQKKIIRWTREAAEKGTPMPAQAAQLARLAFLASRLNFALSFPMLFFMAAASHYPLFGR